MSTTICATAATIGNPEKSSLDQSRQDYLQLTNHRIAELKKEKREKSAPKNQSEKSGGEKSGSGNSGGGNSGGGNPGGGLSRRHRDWKRLHESFAAETGVIVVNGAMLRSADPANGIEGIKNAVIETKRPNEPLPQTQEFIRYLIRQCALYINLGESTESFRKRVIPMIRAAVEAWWGGNSSREPGAGSREPEVGSVPSNIIALDPVLAKMICMQSVRQSPRLHWKQQLQLWNLSREIARDEKNDRRRQKLQDRLDGRAGNDRISAVAPPPLDPRRMRRPRPIIRRQIGGEIVRSF